MTGTGAARVLVLGVGNEARGDDAAGLRVARILARALRPVPAATGRTPAGGGRDGVAIREARPEAASLLDAWSGFPSVLVVDAMVTGASPPGTVARFEAHARPLPAPAFRSPSTHALGIAEAVEIARTLGTLPRRLIVFGIEAASFGAGESPAPEVEAGIERAAEAVRAEVAALLSPARSSALP